MWPFEKRFPELRVPELQDEYDYIIVGGGTAGCVLARRLAEARRWTVLLVERGDARDNWLDRSPMFSSYWFSDKKHGVTWQDPMSEELEAQIIAGKGLGGTSRINGMQYTRGVPGTYNAWANAGHEGWGYRDLKPYYEKAEGCWDPDMHSHYGKDGPLQIEAPPRDFRFGVSRQVAYAATKLGLPMYRDVNDAHLPPSGCFLLHLTTSEDGHRSSTFRAYLPKRYVLGNDDILSICTNTIARKVEFQRTSSGSLRASGVVLQQAKPGSHTRFVAARKEVILCCGALMTPQLLLLSGIGPAKHLQEVGVPVTHELNGVGSNLQDHVGTPLFFYAPIWDTWVALFLRPWWLLWQLVRYLVFGDGWIRDYYVEAHIYTRSEFLGEGMQHKELETAQRDASRPENVPNMEIMIGAICDFRPPNFDRSRGGYQLLPALLQPRSRGTVRLRSSDPFDYPAVDLAFLSAPEDRTVLRAAIRLCLRLVQTMRVGGYETSAFRAPHSTDDSEIDRAIDAHSQSFWHYSSTCRMGALDDPEPGVVDDNLRVHGFENLRICDASVFPQIPAAHLQAPVVAVAEKCADIIKASV